MTEQRRLGSRPTPCVITGAPEGLVSGQMQVSTSRNMRGSREYVFGLALFTGLGGALDREKRETIRVAGPARRSHPPFPCGVKQLAKRAWPGFGLGARPSFSLLPGIRSSMAFPIFWVIVRATQVGEV